MNKLKRFNFFTARSQIIVVSGLIILINGLNACQPKNKSTSLLTNSITEMQALKQGYIKYRYKSHLFLFGEHDTTTQIVENYFIRQPKDTLLGLHLYSRKMEQLSNAPLREALYLTDTALTYQQGKQEGVSYNVKKHGKTVCTEMNDLLHPSVLGPKSSKLFGDSVFNHLGHHLSFLYEEQFQTFHTDVFQLDIVKSKGGLLNEPRVSRKILVWVNETDRIPVKIEVHDKISYNKKQDTLHFFRSFEMLQYNFKRAVEEKLKLAQIPTFIRFSSYIPDYEKSVLPYGQKAPNWSLKSISGDACSLDSLQGQVVVLDFFYQACKPCKAAMPTFKEIMKKYDRQTVAVIGINPIDKSEKGLKAYIDQNHILYPIFQDLDKTVAQQYRVKYYPTVYILDQKGKVVYGATGWTEKSHETILRKIKSLIRI